MSYLSDIDAAAEQVPYGEIQVTLKRHNGKTTKVSVGSYDEQRFPETADAVAYVLQSLKNATQSRETASLTFTVMLKNGKITSVIQQGYQSNDYR